MPEVSRQLTLNPQFSAVQPTLEERTVMKQECIELTCMTTAAVERPAMNGQNSYHLDGDVACVIEYID